MRLNGYTKFCAHRVKISLVVSLLLLTSCATPVNERKNTQEQTLKSLGSNIVDMVNTQDKEFTQDTTKISATKQANLYLTTQSSRLANVSTATINKYHQALALISKKEYQQAEQLLDQIMHLEPRLSGVYVNKAVIAYQQQDLSKAEYWLDKAVMVNSLNPYAHNFKGLLLRKKGAFEQAKQSYLKALASWPDYADAHVNLAILLELYRGQLLQAKQHYQAYLVLNPEDKKVKAYLAGLAIKIKRAGIELPKQTATNNIIVKEKSEVEHAVN